MTESQRSAGPARVSRLVLLAALVAAPALAGEADEPPAAYFFELGGKAVPIELDKPFDLKALGSEKSVTLRVGPNRKFTYAGVEFLYPRQYAWEAELEKNLATWTLSGNDCKVMVHRYPGISDVAPMVNGIAQSMLKQFKLEGQKPTDVKLELQGGKLTGKRIEILVATHRIFTEVYGMKSAGGVVLLVLQDSPTESGGQSPERVEMGKLLAQSFKGPK
jgi:hypothetical protein